MAFSAFTLIHTKWGGSSYRTPDNGTKSITFLVAYHAFVEEWFASDIFNPNRKLQQQIRNMVTISSAFVKCALGYTIISVIKCKLVHLYLFLSVICEASYLTHLF